MPSGNNADPIFVAIWMVTYNHQEYIQQAIESVVMQKTDFRYKLFIGEDCSTDGTRDICRKMKLLYPDKIELILNETNLGPTGNAANVYKACYDSGAKYIAMLEGDDYWIDSLKLQKQVNLFDSNEDVSLCFHQALVLRDNESRLFNQNLSSDSFFDFYDLITENFISTASSMFRNPKDAYPPWLFKLNATDWGLHLWNAQKGRVAYLSDCMSVYRIHNEGIWSGMDYPEMLKRGIENLQQLDEAFEYKYHKHFKVSIEKKERKIKRITSPSESTDQVKRSNSWRIKSWLRKRINSLLH